jgi:shikimate kinase
MLMTVVVWVQAALAVLIAAPGARELAAALEAMRAREAAREMKAVSEAVLAGSWGEKGWAQQRGLHWATPTEMHW